MEPAPDPLSNEELYRKMRVFNVMVQSEDILERRIGRVGQRTAQKLRPRYHSLNKAWREWFDRAWALRLLRLEFSKHDYDQYLSLYEKVRELEGELPPESSSA